jgi:NAD(P)H dehydrogenase (quinone)
MTVNLRAIFCWRQWSSILNRCNLPDTPLMGPRGVNGPIDDILFPINHGVLYYPGFDVLPPFVIHRAGRTDSNRFAAVCAALGQRLDDLWKTAPIPYRRQNAGEYDIPALTLKPDVASGQHGYGAHIARKVP